MKASETLQELSPQEKRVLIALHQIGRPATPEEVFEIGDFSQQVEVMNAASWLQSKGLIVIQESARKSYSLRNREVVSERLPERKVLDFAHEKGGMVESSELTKILRTEEISIAIGWLKRKGLADIEKSDGKIVISITPKGESMSGSMMDDERVLSDLSQNDLSEDEVDGKIISQLKSRQDLISERLIVSRKLSLTDAAREVVDLGIELKDEVAQIAPELLQTGRWKEVTFRKYDVRTFAPSVYPGKKHPLTRMADEVRRIFVQMGFTEIDDEYVQPAFWNMDALFTPQDHPARDLQDTFYLKNPARIEIDDEELIRVVKSVHEDGWNTGSLGWRYEWSREEAERALLRTHTTVCTIKYLAKNPDPPVKVFSLSRIFRNEAIDTTHLPEFVQIEGIIMEKGASFDMLCGVLREFYRQMGFEEVRLRPGYFPYTEPSAEVEVHYNGKWMELGGAGVFRPEVTAPFGVRYPVLAWGLGFERLAMLRWNLTDIRELYISDIDLLRKSPIF
ncbi:MAG: phenylalanine--tRNA ligase subunit alpha [Methanomassiliicoccales archaeon]|nr:phenylalanine--tRNA ligase subunit alpha [Methanomassiliicoccales archaeon]